MKAIFAMGLQRCDRDLVHGGIERGKVTGHTSIRSHFVSLS